MDYIWILADVAQGGHQLGSGGGKGGVQSRALSLQGCRRLSMSLLDEGSPSLGEGRGCSLPGPLRAQNVPPL